MTDPPNPAAPHRPADPSPAAPSPAPSPAPAPKRRRAERMADSMPDWLGSIRFRLTALYSVVLFGLAAIMVLGLYLVLANRLRHDEAYKRYPVDEIQPIPGGFQITRHQMLDQARVVEHLANERALALLRTYSLSALGLLFLASLATGWFVAGRVLAPIGRITGVAREIQATDLSRRIALRGPPDELTELADTFDAMLARLDDAFESQQRFIQEASHELRNPLAIIRTNLDVVLADPDPDPAELRRVAELVRGTSSRMSRLVDDLLAYGRRGAPARERERVDLGPLIEAAADEFAAPASARALRLEVAVVPGSSAVGDRLALRQVVTNLLANAVRLAPQGSVISLRAGHAPDGAWLSVADQGPGIAPEDRAHVFDRFWRGDQASARQEGRSGLGLAIVAQIVGQHGGSVDVEPTAEGGSRFIVRLPA
ncbi:MAG: Two-component sensor histidine kinase [Acidimicrobiales bacterium]|nr:Two-component sensor histidine kinase [Acidimicrobiales bacterium]